MAKRRKGPAPALAYLRTSTAANIGADKDSERRQHAAIEAFAKQAGFEIIEWFYDEAVSGADRLEDRPGFADLLESLEGNGVHSLHRVHLSRPAISIPPKPLALMFPSAISSDFTGTICAG